MEEIQEACPKCSKLHLQGIYERQPDTKVLRPRDVQCECGLALRWAVPIFKVTMSGYTLRPLRDNEVGFFPENAKGAEAL